MNLSIKESGDGFELIDAQGEVVAWMLEKKWALKILFGLEISDGRERQETPEPEENGDAG
jgi:hypothetical protein